jgi:hypothetical protein
MVQARPATMGGAIKSASAVPTDLNNFDAQLKFFWEI